MRDQESLNPELRAIVDAFKAGLPEKSLLNPRENVFSEAMKAILHILEPFKIRKEDKDFFTEHLVICRDALGTFICDAIADSLMTASKSLVLNPQLLRNMAEGLLGKAPEIDEAAIVDPGRVSCNGGEKE